ncbi:MAG: tetratricopeptide repeat protein [Spirochaetales bacterium]|nr:tetratricopeptide repeat protein [Spirochaetales bacterium]
MGGNYSILKLKKIKIIFLAVVLSIPVIFLNAESRTNAVELYKAGKIAQEQENYYLAVEKYKASLDINPYYINAMKGLAECFFYLNEYQESLRFIALGKKYNKNDLELLALEGRVWIVLGDLNKAMGLFNRVLTLQPNNIEAIAGLALLDIASGRTNFAVKQFEEALRVSPSHRQALLALAIINQQLHNYTASERYLELALKYHGNDALVHFIAGKYYYNRAYYAKAERHLKTALGLNPHYIAVRQLLGNIYIAQKNYSRAVEILTAVPDSHPLYYLARYTLAKAYGGLGDMDNAIRNFKKVLAIRPDDEVSRIALENLIIESSLPERDPRRAELAAERVQRGKLFKARYMLNMALLEYRISVKLDNASVYGKMGMYGMAEIYKLRGFPMKYLDKLLAIRKNFTNVGSAQDEIDRTITNDIERYEYKKKELVSSKWQIDQYLIKSTPLKFALFNMQSVNNEIHPQAGYELTKFFDYILFLYEKKIEVTKRADISSFEEGFRVARNSYTDFFLIISFNETERSISTECGLYLSRTGALLHKFKISRTGNDRVQSVLLSLGEKLNAMLPLRGKIINRKFDQAIIDLGGLHGLQINDKLLILKKGAVSLHNGRVGFNYAESDIVGDFTVTALDEVLAEGKLTQKGYHDLMNVGDEVIFEPKVEESEEKTAPVEANDLLRELMELR